MGKDLYLKTDKNEFFPTQEFLKNELYAELDKYNFKLILDPCCGDGGLEKFGPEYDYIYGLYDIEDRGVNAKICDFLKAEVDRDYDCAVINPPFGLTVDFVNKAKEFTNDIFLIAPVKTVIKNFGEYIKWCSVKCEYGFKCFGIMTTVGLFHLHFHNIFTFGIYKKPTYADFLGPEIDVKDSWETHFIETDKAPNKYFIVDRLTKARVVRYEQFIKDDDLYSPNDDSAFIAVSGNVNIKAGDKVKRRILTFNTFEEMKAWQEFFNSHEKELRNYMYRYGDTILKYKQKPFITAQNIGEMQQILMGEC